MKLMIINGCPLSSNVYYSIATVDTSFKDGLASPVEVSCSCELVK